MLFLLQAFPGVDPIADDWSYRCKAANPVSPDAVVFHDGAAVTVVALDASKNKVRVQRHGHGGAPPPPPEDMDAAALRHADAAFEYLRNHGR